MKITGVYKITNTVTGDFYVGSSRDVKRRWSDHKRQSTWKERPNSSLYKDMQKYGTDKFYFEVLAEVEIASLKETEQRFIEKFKPTYNDRNANGLDIEKYKKYMKEYMKEYNKSDKCKEYLRKYNKSDKGKEYRRKYNKSDKGKESLRKARNKYYSRLCCYNGETLTFSALYQRFIKKGLEHPTQEAKKYLLVPKKTI